MLFISSGTKGVPLLCLTFLLALAFQDMLKERGVAPFSKWDKELPKIVFDPRFKVRLIQYLEYSILRIQGFAKGTS